MMRKASSWAKDLSERVFIPTTPAQHHSNLPQNAKTDMAQVLGHLPSHGTSSQRELDTLWFRHPAKRVPLNPQWEGGAHPRDHTGPPGLASFSVQALWDATVPTEGEGGLVQRTPVHEHPCSSASCQPNGHQGV